MRFTRSALSAVRSVAGTNSLPERAAREVVARHQIRRVRGPNGDKWADGKSMLLAPRQPTDRRIGIFLAGGCDTPALYKMGPLLENDLRATIAMHRRGGIASNNPELLLQRLAPPPPSEVKEVTARLELESEYFDPGFFDPQFAVPGLRRFGTFDKNVIVLSLGAGMTRTLYRHKQLGYLVDPGGMWLNQDLGRVLTRGRDDVDWFKERFTSTGRPTTDRFKEGFSQLVTELRARTGAEVLALNTLTVEPGEPTHNYQLKRRPEALRRRLFHLALVELGAELDLPIVDVDHVAKCHGVSSHVDFAHFPGELQEPLAAEAHRLLCARGVLP